MATTEEKGWTPGPWLVEPGAGKGAWIGGNGSDQWAALALGSDDEVARANAHLISAAPVLYDAGTRSAVVLDEAANIVEGLGNPGVASLFRLAADNQRAALAKAEGRNT